LRAKFEIQQLHTMCLYVLENFLPNPLTESALNRSCSVILLTGIVPSGQDSPDKLHNWKLSLKLLMWLYPVGLSGGSCL